MATVNFTPLLGMALPTSGDLSGTWGTEVNNFITTYVDAGVAGTQTISGSQTAVTLSITNGNSLVQVGAGATGSAQYAVINCTGNPAATLVITVPSSSKTYLVINATSTSQSVTVKGSATTGVTIASGERAVVSWNGTDFIIVATNNVASASLTGTLPVGRGGTGNTTVQGAMNTFAGAVTSGSYLRGNGTNVVMSAIQAGDVPTLNQNTTGTASNVTGTVAVANGGSGQTTAQSAMNTFAGAVTSGSYLRGNGTNVVMSAIQAGDVPTLNQNTTGTASNVTGTVAVANGGTGGTTQAAARTGLGATTVGANVFTLTNPSAITFPRFNADNTVSALDAATFRTAIGAGTGSGTVTSVGATSPVASSGGTAPTISLNANYGDTLNPYASKTANNFLAAPNGSAGVPTFRAIVAADIPTLNQNTTGTAANVTGTVAVANGGSGQTTAQAAMNTFAGAVTNAQYLRGNGTNVVMSAIQAADVPTLNQNTTGTAANVTGTVAIANGGTGGTTQATARTGLGATTVGANLFTITDPSAFTYIRINSDNTVSALTATDFRTAIGAGTGNGTVTSVGATSPVASSGGTAPTISLNANYGDTLNPYASKTANNFLAAPNGSAGAPTFRAIVAADIPTLNQNTTGTAANVTGTVAIANGGTGATSAANAATALGVGTSSNVQFNSLGIGTAASATAGEIRATNNVTAFFTSDRKFKENIRDIPNALDAVDAIGGKLFDWTDAYIASKGGEDGFFVRKADFGVIAQDTQAAFPLAVRTREDGTLSVDYEKMCALAFAAIKELAARVKALEAR